VNNRGGGAPWKSVPTAGVYTQVDMQAPYTVQLNYVLITVYYIYLDTLFVPRRAASYHLCLKYYTHV